MAYKSITMEINDDLTKSQQVEIKKLRASVEELEGSLRSLASTQNKLTSSANTLEKAYKDVASEIKKTASAVKESNDQLEKNAKLLNSTKSTAGSAGVAIDELTKNYKELSESQKSAATTSENFKAASVALKNDSKESGESTKASAEDFKYLEKTFESLDKTLDSLKVEAGEFAPELESLKAGFGGLKTGLEVVKDGFNGVGSALKATGFGLLMLILKSLEEYFQHDKIGLKRFQGALAAVGVVTKEIEKALVKLGGAIVDALINPVDTIKSFWDSLVQKFSKTFSALGDIISGVLTFDSAKIKTGVTHLSEEFDKAVTIVKDGYDKAKSYFTGLAHDAGKAFDNAYKKAGENAGHFVKKIKRSHEQLSLRQITAADFFKRQQQQYDQELALLNDQLNKKLITEESYYKAVDELAKKYPSAIIKAAPSLLPDFAKAKRQLQTEQQQKIVEKDEEKLKQAVWPWQKFEAEKKLIQDKYAFEILQANGNKEKIKELTEKSQEEISTLTEKYEKQRSELITKAAQQVTDKAFSLIAGGIGKQSEAKLKALEKDKANELNNKNLTSTQRKAIEDKYQKKENQEKVKAFKANQKVQVAQAVINGSIGVQKTIAEFGMPFAIPNIIPVIASTAAQVATILSQKPPAYAKGGRFVSDGRGALLSGYRRDRF